MEYILVYTGRNWMSNVDGPNVALTVVRQGEYFQFYIALFPSAGALDLVAAPGPQLLPVLIHTARAIVGTRHLRALQSRRSKDIPRATNPTPTSPSASTQESFIQIRLSSGH